MNHWHFVMTAYVLTIGATLGIGLWCWLSMRSAERAVEQMRERP